MSVGHWSLGIVASSVWRWPLLLRQRLRLGRRRIIIRVGRYGIRIGFHGLEFHGSGVMCFLVLRNYLLRHSEQALCKSTRIRITVSRIMIMIVHVALECFFFFFSPQEDSGTIDHF